MKIEKVAKLSPEARFLYWMRERHNIYLKRKNGKPRPWTNDEVLQNYFFTNPYRENDKTTVWFREHVRYPLRDKPEVLMATVIFRWFNRIETGMMLNSHGLLTDWDENYAVNELRELEPPVFTGAYMIKAGNGPPGCKIPNVCEAITNIWNCRKEILEEWDYYSLEIAWNTLKQYDYLGGFMSYEIVTDLRHTKMLKRAHDIDTWANPGPGAKRGLNRLLDRSLHSSVNKIWSDESQKLLKRANTKLSDKYPNLEMREIEHSLCEFDKYERARTGEGGRMKRRYHGQA